MKKILTIVLDGFGLRNTKNGNAVKLAKMPTFVNLWNNYPHCQLLASQNAVGLEKNQMGNSEVGHTTIGAGRLIKQNYMQIEELLNSEEIFRNKTYLEMINYSISSSKPIHLMALCSDGGIHSHLNFILKMIELLHQSGIKEVYVHAITDGRDTATTSSYSYIKKINKLLKEYSMGNVVDICGRYYAMDRDQKWERTKVYSDCIINGKAAKIKNIEKTINYCYEKGITDEFLPPLIIDENHTIKDGDILLWFNYRLDRAKQILNVLTNPDFKEYKTEHLKSPKVYTIYPIVEAISSKSLLNNQIINNSLGVYLSQLGLSQSRIAETEKYAHVTYFFDGGNEYILDKCDYFLIPSPKVKTYDLKPEMSCYEVKKKCIQCLEDDYDFIFMNFANPDMVGHTGNLEATINALEHIDKCLKEIIESANNNFYTTIILSDHGNCDYMLDENDNPVTTHSIYPVPFIITDKKVKLKNGDLTQVAPTILKYMDIALPKEMKKTKTLFETEK